MPAGREMDALIAVSLELAKNKGTILEFYAPFSTDISAAFEVIQKMHEMKYKYTLHGYFMGAELQIATFDHQDWADANPLYKAVSDSAPLAICRAALLAVMK